MLWGKHDGSGKKKITVEYKFWGRSLLLSSRVNKTRWSVDQTYQNISNWFQESSTISSWSTTYWEKKNKNKKILTNGCLVNWSEVLQSETWLALCPVTRGGSSSQHMWQLLIFIRRAPIFPAAPIRHLLWRSQLKIWNAKFFSTGETESLYGTQKMGERTSHLVSMYLNKKGKIWEPSVWTSAPKSSSSLPLGCLNPSAKW